MCGGCGAPLSHNDTPLHEGATVAIADLPNFADRTPPGVVGYAPGLGVGDTQPTPPTPVDLRSSAYLTAMPATPVTPVSRPTTPPTYIPPGGMAPLSPTPSPTPQRRRGAFWARVAGIVVVALLVLGGLSYGSWGLFAAPSLHTSVDAELHARFAILVNAAFRTTGATKTVSLTNAQATSALGPADSSEWLQNLAIQFNQGVIYLTYTFAGSSGDIATHIFVADGRFKVAGTTLNGYVAGDAYFAPIETGDQAEAAFNAALAQLPASEHALTVSVANDMLTFTTA